MISTHGYSRMHVQAVEYKKWLQLLKEQVAKETTALTTQTQTHLPLKKSALTNTTSTATTASSAAATDSSGTAFPDVSHQSNVLSALLPVFGESKEDMGTPDVMPQFHSVYTFQAIVQSGGETCPVPNEQLLETYFKAFHKMGFM